MKTKVQMYVVMTKVLDQCEHDETGEGGKEIMRFKDYSSHYRKGISMQREQTKRAVHR